MDGPGGAGVHPEDLLLARQHHLLALDHVTYAQTGARSLVHDEELAHGQVEMGGRVDEGDGELARLVTVQPVAAREGEELPEVIGRLREGGKTNDHFV